MNQKPEHHAQDTLRFTELGLHPQAILALVLTGNVPPGWSVHTGRKKSLMREWFRVQNIVFLLVVCGILAIPAFLCVNLSTWISLITDAGYRASFNFWRSPVNSLPYIFLMTFAGIYLLLLIGSFWIDLVSVDPVLVILPDGIVEFDQKRDTSVALIFADLTTIRRHQHIDPDNKNKEMKPGALDLAYHNGSTRTWTPLTPTTDEILFAFQQWQTIRDDLSES